MTQCGTTAAAFLAGFALLHRSVDAFQPPLSSPPSLPGLTTTDRSAAVSALGVGSSSSGGRRRCSRRWSAISATFDDANHRSSGNGGTTNSATTPAVSTSVDAPETKEEEAEEVDDYEAERTEVRRRRSASNARRRVAASQPTYDVILPFTDGKAAATATASTASSLVGASLRQVLPGKRLSELALDVDTLRFQTYAEELRGQTGSGAVSDDDDAAAMVGTVQMIDPAKHRDETDETFKGVVVSSVVRGGLAWKAGVRAGDALVATSATMGEKLWPKSTLDGVRSAISSRKVMSSSMTYQFRRGASELSASEVVEEFELVLTRPIGIKVEDTEEGYVEIQGFADELQSSVETNLRLGDRIVAVDSSLGGQMWPVSNVEGLVSACTSRLPGQPVRLGFERVVEVGEWTRVNDGSSEAGATPSVAAMEENAASLTGAVDGFRKLKEDVASTTQVAAAQSDAFRSTGSKTHMMLLSRCRDVLRTYTARQDKKSERNVAASAADRVLEALADASAPLDGRTLALIMKAYLSCRKPESAIRAFEAAVGLAADGSASAVDVAIEGKTKGSRIVPDVSALDLYTGTALLRAHALLGDYHAARRVLAAMEGDLDRSVSGLNAGTDWANAASRSRIALDTRCYNTALSAAAKARGKSGLEVAIELFDNMAEPLSEETGNGGKPKKNLVTYNTMIGAFAAAGRTQDAFTIFYSLKQAGGRPDKFTYTSLIKANVKDGDIQAALDLLDDMKFDGVKADIVTYNTVIEALCKQYRWYDARDLVNEMESVGIAPDSMTYGLLMKGLLRADKPGPCLTLFETACADDRTAALTENVQLYTTAIAAASAIGDHERAVELVSRMNKAGVKPNTKTLTALMGACLSSEKYDYAVEVFKKMSKPDGYATSLGLRAYCDAGDFQSATEILTEQRSGQHTMSGKEVMSSYNYIIRSALKSTEYSVARKSLAELLGSGYIPSKVTYRMIVEGLGLMQKARGKAVQAQALNEPVDTDRFDFLLFVLDSIAERKLGCEGSFYATVLFEGARAGGLRKRLSSLLVNARAATKIKGNKIETEITAAPGKEQGALTWEDMLNRCSEGKGRLGNITTLPLLRVRVGDRDFRRVLAAEQSVSFGNRRERAAVARRRASR